VKRHISGQKTALWEREKTNVTAVFEPWRITTWKSNDLVGDLQHDAEYLNGRG